MITQNVTLSSALEVKYKEWNKILILDSAFQEPGPGPVNFVFFFFFLLKLVFRVQASVY